MTDSNIETPGQSEANEVFPQRVRFIAYLVVTVLLLALTAWQAADGNWLVAAITFLGSLQALLATTKTTQRYTITKE